MTADETNFVTAVQMRDMLDKVIANNPEARMMAYANGSGFIALDVITDDLDPDGDVRFGLRSYDTGKKVKVMEVADFDSQD